MEPLPVPNLQNLSWSRFIPNQDKHDQMHFVDVYKPERVNRKPDETKTLLASGTFEEAGFLVLRIELRLYKIKTDKKLGPYSVITSFVKTDRGSVEMVYDEGFWGPDQLEQAAKFLTSHLGLSALVVRSVISLRDHLG